MVGGVRDRQVALGVQAVGEQVVEHAAVLAAEHAVLRAARRRPSNGDLPTTSLESSRCSSSSACAPDVSISPMCETSKTPQPSRTARCSARIARRLLETGISQPANSTSFAPAATMAVEQRRPVERLRRGATTTRRLAKPAARPRPHQRRGALSAGTAERRCRRRRSRASSAGDRRCAGRGRAGARGCRGARCGRGDGRSRCRSRSRAPRRPCSRR